MATAKAVHCLWNFIEFCPLLFSHFPATMQIASKRPPTRRRELLLFVSCSVHTLPPWSRRRVSCALINPPPLNKVGFRGPRWPCYYEAPGGRRGDERRRRSWRWLRTLSVTASRWGEFGRWWHVNGGGVELRAFLRSTFSTQLAAIQFINAPFSWAFSAAPPCRGRYLPSAPSLCSPPSRHDVKSKVSAQPNGVFEFANRTVSAMWRLRDQSRATSALMVQRVVQLSSAVVSLEMTFHPHCLVWTWVNVGWRSKGPFSADCPPGFGQSAPYSCRLPSPEWSALKSPKIQSNAIPRCYWVTSRFEAAKAAS